MRISLEAVVAAAHGALKSEAARINALNVYPVPDGDTGTNMLLTLESIVNETSGKAYETPEEASKAGARAALMGARGNSGVILSQMLRGASQVLSEAESFDVEAFVAALEGARDRAYSSMREPVEGTMLTVIKDASSGAREALGKSVDLIEVSRAAAREAHASVRRTTDLLDMLREAGVVDAGGLGVAVILDGIHAWLSGEVVVPPENGTGEEDTPDLGAMSVSEDEAWGYCTEFIVTSFSGSAEEFSEHIHDIGRSVLVVPDEDVVKVHLHTQDPGGAMSYAGGFGRLTGVKVDDMEAQVRERPQTQSGGQSPKKPADLAVVAASRGEGNRKLFEAMGVVVIEGGQGANPSAADFARAVERTGARTVVLLPNNKNIVPTAEQVSELVEQQVEVVATQSIASGLAAMVGFDAEGEPEEVVEEMREILASLRYAEITHSVREASVSGREVPEGACMGLLDGELAAVGEGVGEVALELAGKMLEEGADVLTLVCGEGLEKAEAEELARRVGEMDDGVEVEVRDGGQPMYPLQMVAE